LILDTLLSPQWFVGSFLLFLFFFLPPSTPVDSEAEGGKGLVSGVCGDNGDGDWWVGDGGGG
jgi:hypothetical protein